MTYTPEDYARERAICDKAAAYAEAVMSEGGAKRRRNYLTTEEAAHPDYAACDNDMRGRVEQFELLRDLPDRFVAYLASGAPDGLGARIPVTVWTGLPLGVATVHTVGKARSQFGERQRFGRAVIGGRVYRWQGGGAGMFASFRAVERRA